MMNARPTLSLSCASPVAPGSSNVDEFGLTPRISSWGSIKSHVSQFGGSDYSEMEGLPSPMIDVGGKANWEFRNAMADSITRRQSLSSLAGNPYGSQSLTKSKFNKTSSFFDSDSSDVLSPPPNPMSRASSLRVASNSSDPGQSWGRRSEGSSSRSWLERADDPDRPPVIVNELSKSLSYSTGYPSPNLKDSNPTLATSPNSIPPSPPFAPLKLTSTIPEPFTASPTTIDPPSRGARFLNFTKKIVGATPSQTVPPTTLLPPSPVRSEPSPVDILPGGLSIDDFETDAASKPGELVGEFVIVKLLGKGAFSRVALASRKGKEKEEIVESGGLVALKMIAKRSYEGNERMRISVVREVEVLKHIHHPSLVSLSSSFSTPTHTVLVLDYAPGGELFDFLADWHQEMTEELARRMFGELCGVVGWMHSIGLVHRDIKLENILLTSRPFPCSNPATLLQSLPSPILKLTDFGLSRFINPASPLLSTRCGSEAYAAPELIMGKKYDGRKTDAWAIGVVLFALITGGMPFIELEPEVADGRGRRTYLMKIAKGEYSWPKQPGVESGQLHSPIAEDGVEQTSTSDATRLVTPALKSLVGSLLVRDPEKRLKIEQVWHSEWMQGIGRPTKMVGFVSQRDEVDSFAKEREE